MGLFVNALHRSKMVKIFKPGRVIIMLRGRQTGKKGIVVKTNEDGTRDRPFEHALVVGIDGYPRRVIKGMSRKKIAKRSKIKPFIRVVNLKHMIQPATPPLTSSSIRRRSTRRPSETLAEGTRSATWSADSLKKDTRLAEIGGSSRSSDSKIKISFK